MGVCASSGGMFNNYAIVQGVDHVVPVDMYLPGCPPRPEMLIDAILKLHEKIGHDQLGANRRARRSTAERGPARPASSHPTCRDEGRPGDRLPRAARPRGRRCPKIENGSCAPSTGSNLPGSRPIAARRGRRRPARACSASTAPATPPATAAWSGSSLPGASPAPYGGYFDEVADELDGALDADGPSSRRDREGRRRPRRADVPRPPRAAGRGGCQALRDDPALRFELCSGVSGVHYPATTGRELHAVYHLLSITHNRRIRLEVGRPGRRPAHPALVRVYPTADWHERET